MKNNKSGFGLLEIIVGIAVISISIFGITSVSAISLRAINEALNNVKVSFLLEEGVEAVKILRDTSWLLNIAPLISGDNNYLNFNGSTWQTVSVNTFIDSKFERKFILENVLRDANYDIANSGTLDTNTKKFTVLVSWRERTGTTTKQISGYITNIFNN